ncbi:hypothetical protein ACN8ZM_40465 (plasmid) [Burkholderia aenigmatica]|uniref:hypothetical protein n=1 Tax=Burkholderia aenigmatica TaxID=2015348 RepID=UPI003B436049
MNEVLSNLMSDPVLLLVTVCGLACVVSIIRSKGRLLRDVNGRHDDSVVYNPTTGAYVQPFSFFDEEGNPIVR